MALNIDPDNSNTFTANPPVEPAAPKAEDNKGKKVKTPKTPKAPRPPKVKKPGSGRRLLGLTAAGTLGIMTLGGTFVFLNGAQPSMVPAYQLQNAIPANAPAVLSDFAEILVPASALEGQLISLAELNGATWYAEEDLQPGALATAANFNLTTRVDIGELDDPSLLAQTFTASAEDSVGGRLRAGDFVNILQVIQGEGGTSAADFVLSKVLLLDVSAEPAGVTAAGSVIGGETATQYNGIPALYTVALNPEQTKILTAAKQSGSLTVVLTRADAPSIKGAGVVVVTEPTVAPVAPTVTDPAVTPANPVVTDPAVTPATPATTN
jgi:hypothetical protein